MSSGDEQGLKECEAYVQEHKIQQVLKECIVQVSTDINSSFSSAFLMKGLLK